MSHRQKLLVIAGAAVVLSGLVLRAVTVHSVGNAPLIYRVTTNNNDLDSVEGVAPPGRLVELWYRQRNFREGLEGAEPGQDPFSWCSWKNGGNAVQLGAVWADARGKWRIASLRQATTVMLFPSAGSGTTCQGGILTQLLPRVCDAPGVNCTAWTPPALHWLNVKRQNPVTATAGGAVSGAETAAIAVADGPDDGPEPTSVFDVDSNGIDTRQPGFMWGQRVSWKCGAGGTAVCPSIVVHDGTTITTPDPEYPFLLGTIQGHAPGGSIFAAAAIARGEPLGFTVNVNARLRGNLDINLGCDRKKLFDFSVPFVY
jgi:hypothetical protein